MGQQAIFFLSFIPVILCQTYQAVDQGLTIVPNDVPNDTTRVHLDENLISNISVASFAHIRLVELTVSGNKLTQFPNLTLHADTLKILKLSYNLITNITSELVNELYRLRTLALRGNPLGTLPPLLTMSLIILNVQNCSLTEAPVIAKPQKMKLLMLGYNEITALPDDYLLNMPILEQINILCNKQMTKFINLPTDRVSPLKNIYASKTGITEVAAETMAVLGNLQKLSIASVSCHISFQLHTDLL